MSTSTSTVIAVDEGRKNHLLTGVSPISGRFMLTKPAKMAHHGSERNGRSHKSLEREVVVTRRYTSPVMRREAATAGHDGTARRALVDVLTAVGWRLSAAAGTPLPRTGARGRAASSVFQVDRARDARATPLSGRPGICLPPVPGPHRRALSDFRTAPRGA